MLIGFETQLSYLTQIKVISSWQEKRTVYFKKLCICYHMQHLIASLYVELCES